MRGKIAKWGNSLAVRVPKRVAEGAGLSEGDAVDLTSQPGSIAVSAVSDIPELDELLDRITPENLHAAVDTGAARGGEVW